MTYSEVITDRILSLCKEKKITVNKLATLAGIKQSTLENIVKGNTKSPGLRTMHRIAIGFNMKLSEFLSIDAFDNEMLEDE